MQTDRPYEDADEGAQEAGRRGLSLLGITLRIALASAMIAALSLYARSPARVPPPLLAAAERPFVPATPAAASAIAAPPARLGLAEPGLDPVRVAPGRIDPATGLREDVLMRGAFEAIEAPALRVTLTRGAGAGRTPGLFVLLARRAAGGPGAEGPALAVVRTGAYGRIDTKFGAVETLEATLNGPLRRTCTGFVTRESGFRIDGWLCAPLGQPPAARVLACTLDALRLDDPRDRDAGSAFAAQPGKACDRPTAMADPAGRTGSIVRRAAQAKK